MAVKPTYEELEQRVKELEDLVQKSEVSYREIFDLATDMILIQDINTGEILEVNDETTRATGFTLDEIKKMGVDGFSSKSEEFSPEKAAEYMMKAAQGEPQLFEWGFIDKSGKFHPTEVHMKKVSIRGQDRLLGIVRDISERKQSELMLKESLQEARLSQKETSALLKASQSIPLYKTFKQAARMIFDICRELIGARSGYVALLSEDGQENEVLFLEAGGLPCDVDPELPMPIRGLREVVYRTRKVAYDNDFMESQWMKYMPSGHVQLDNVLFAPLNIKDKTVGIIGIANKPGGFTKRDAEIAATFGDLAAVALTYADYQDKLKKSEKQLQVIFDHAPTIMLLVNEKTEVIRMNQTGLTAAGKSVDKVIGLRSGDIMDCVGSFQNPNGCGFGEDCKSCVIRRTVEKTFADNKNYYKIEAELRIRKQNHIEKHTVLISTSIVNPNNPKTVLITIDDITERKRSEMALQESEARLQAFFENSPAGLLIWDAGDPVRYLAINKTLAAINGRPVAEHIGKTLAEVFDDPQIVHENNQLCRTILKEKTPLVFESTGVPQTGKRVHYMAQYFPIFRSDGKTLGIGAMVFDITTQKETEKKLKDSERRFRELFDNMSAGVAIYKSPDNGQSFIFQNLNKSGLKSASKKADEVIGREVREVFPGVVDLGLLDVFKRVWKTAVPEHHPSSIYKDNLLELWVENYVCKLPSGELVAIYEDTTARVKAENALRESEKFLDTIVENIPNMIFVKDSKELRFVRFNKAGEDLIGYSRKDLIGKNDYDFFPKEQADFFTNKDRAVLEQGTLLDIPEEPIQTNNKSTRILHTKKIPILDENSQPLYLLGISEDVTEHKILEDQLRQAQKMESIGTLAGGIAHDFNNILFPIVGLSEILLEDLPTDSLEYENAQEILKAGKRGSDLVKQILTFSRQSEHKMVPVRTQNILREVIKLARSTIPSDIEIEHEIQNDCGLVTADPIQVHQIAMNLITNAYHAVEQDGGRISLHLEETKLGNRDLAGTVLEPGLYAKISVSDTGRGIDPDVMDKIFEPYFTTKEQGKGTGLGLAVVYGIVREHKGDIKVGSKLSQGTTFEVYLPLLPRDADSLVIKEIAELKIGTEKILLVDDEDAIARLEQQMLERLGYQVTVHVDSLEALRIFRDKPDAFDLVMTDMTMPKMTGDQLAKELISIKPDLPVIICTGFSERINQEKIDAIGIKGFLMKPIVKLEMAKVVRKVLDEAKGTGQQ